MTVDVTWGPRVGYAGTGSFQSGVALIDDLTSQTEFTVQSFSATSFVFEEFFNGLPISVEFVGSGFSQSNGIIEAVGELEDLIFYAGTVPSADQVLLDFDFPISIEELFDAVVNDNDGVSPRAIEDLFTLAGLDLCWHERR